MGGGWDACSGHVHHPAVPHSQHKGWMWQKKTWEIAHFPYSKGGNVTSGHIQRLGRRQGIGRKRKCGPRGAAQSQDRWCFEHNSALEKGYPGLGRWSWWTRENVPCHWDILCPSQRQKTPSPSTTSRAKSSLCWNQKQLSFHRGHKFTSLFWMERNLGNSAAGTVWINWELEEFPSNIAAGMN